MIPGSCMLMMTSEGQADVNLDLVLAELGQFGRYQQLAYCYILIVIIFNAMYNTQYIFTAGPTQYRCKVPQCESSPPKFSTNGWGKWALPGDGKCNRMKATGAGCAATSFSDETERCSSWIYEDNNTIVSEYGLACQEWKRTMVGTVRNAGVFTALPISAIISDAFGRRIALILTAVAPAIVGMVRAFCNNYMFYLGLEYIDAVLGAGSYSVGYVLAFEIVGIDKRVIGGNIISMTFAVGQMLAGLTAWLFPYWRTYTMVIYTPSLLFIFYYCLVEESVRWLLSQRRKNEAVRLIYKIAAVNNKELSPATVKVLTSDRGSEQAVDTQEQRDKRPIFVQLVRSKPMMFRVSICSFWWITVTFIYYGLSINAVMLPGNRYLNYILIASIEVPGCVLSMLTLNRFGRKKPIMMCFFLCGLSVFTLPYATNYAATTTLNMCGKLCISAIFCSIYIYTVELFPTRARASLVSLCSMMGRLGAMAAPQTPLLMTYMKSLPYLIFGVMALCSGLLLMLTPETLRMELPDTVQQAEDISPSSRSRRSTQQDAE